MNQYKLPVCCPNCKAIIAIHLGLSTDIVPAPQRKKAKAARRQDDEEFDDLSHDVDLVVESNSASKARIAHYKSMGMTEGRYKAHVAKYGNSTAPGSPMRVFTSERARALAKGDKWEITFEDWWRMWSRSKHWEQRGKGGSQYRMARIDPKKPFRATNMKIRKNDGEFDF